MPLLSPTGSTTMLGAHYSISGGFDQHWQHRCSWHSGQSTQSESTRTQNCCKHLTYLGWTKPVSMSRLNNGGLVFLMICGLIGLVQIMSIYRPIRIQSERTTLPPSHQTNTHGCHGNLTQLQLSYHLLCSAKSELEKSPGFRDATQNLNMAIEQIKACLHAVNPKSVLKPIPANRIPSWPSTPKTTADIMTSKMFPSKPLSVSKNISILLDLTSGPPKEWENLSPETMVRSISRLYEGIKIIVAVLPSGKLSALTKLPNVATLVMAEERSPLWVVWDSLVKKAWTKYVLVGRGLVYFDQDANLERLLGVLEEDAVGIAAGAFRTPDGHWFMGCHQSVMRNYSLSYFAGYSKSRHSCVFCHYLDGPFIAKTSLLRQVGFSPKMAALNVLIADLFLTVSKKTQMVVCPDVMFHVKNTSSYDVHDWLPLGRKRELDHININNKIIQFPCPVQVCPTHQYMGLGVTPCCLQMLADQLKFVAKTFDKNGVIYSLDSGTMLGTLKFNGILPWELDSDMAVPIENETILLSLHKYFRKNGFNVTDPERTSYYETILYVCNSEWKIELFVGKPLDHFNDGNYSLSSLAPTQVNLNGMWMRWVPNPGRYVYEEYRTEIYQHAQHNIDYGESWALPYKGATDFRGCKRPGHHACLDQYPTDGVLQFGEPRCPISTGL